LRKFARLYAIEKQIKALSTEQRYVIRQEKSKPLMLELKQWYEANVTKTAKEAAIGKAFIKDRPLMDLRISVKPVARYT
jgi:hypothetical protein